MASFGTPIQFNVLKRAESGLARAGHLETPHGAIETPSFVVVGTNATVKTVSPEEVRAVGAQVVLANTYHLYLEPGEEVVRQAGGLHEFMNWHGPTMTDSGGFQVFSLGAAYGKSLSKIWRKEEDQSRGARGEYEAPLAKITEDGVQFRSHRDGSSHFLTPERSIQVQHAIGADMIFAFDECTSPDAPYEYQKEAMERTHRWAERSLSAHKRNSEAVGHQGLFGIIQGGPFEDLRKESARAISSMDFDGFGLGGSYRKEDIDTAIGWITEMLPEEKPRHLLGIGEPEDMFAAVEQGVDLFDCVTPTRIARNGALLTRDGRINILNARFREDKMPIENDCPCYACANYTKSYLAHLFRVRETFGLRLATIHNLSFITRLVSEMRERIADGSFFDFKKDFIQRYYKNR